MGSGVQSLPTTTMSDTLKQVTGWITDNEQRMIDFLSEYLSYRSIPGEEREVQEQFLTPFFEQEMKWSDVDCFAVDAEKRRPNVNATWNGSGGGNNILFNGHSDVVEVSDKALERWTVDPWKPTIKDNKIFGRGSVDMKGPNTAMIWAVKALMECGVRLKGDVLMSLVIGEEMAEQELGSIAATRRFQAAGYDIPLCLNTEPSNNEIHTVSAGVFEFAVTIPGRETHCSMKNLTQYPQPWGIPQGSVVGVDAIKLMTRLLIKLEELEHEWNIRYRDKIFGSGGYPVHSDIQGVGPTGINATLLEGGTYIASVPGYAKVQGAVYHHPRADAEQLVREMKDVVDSLALTSDWLKDNPPTVAIRELFDWPPYEIPVDHPGCRALATAYQQVTGREAVFSGFKAVNDCAFIQRDCGVPSVTMGPGDLSTGAHGPDEYLPLDQMMEAARTYAAMMMEWCQTSD